MAFICSSSGGVDTIEVRDTNDVVLLSIVSKYYWGVYNPNRRMYPPNISMSSGLDIGYFPYLGSQYYSAMFYPYKLIYVAMYKYSRLTNKNVQETLAELIS